MARADFGRKERDGSRGVLAPAATRHRVTRPSDRASFAVSPLRAGTDWRGIAQMWAGPAFTLGILLIFIFVSGRHWHG